MEIVKDFENKLLNRREIIARYDGGGVTPNRKEVLASIAKQLKADEKLVVVNRIDSHYGLTDITVEAKIYKDEATLKALTPEHIIKRTPVGEVAPVVEEVAPVAAEEPEAEVAAEEPPVEEVSEEASNEKEAVEEEVKE